MNIYRRYHTASHLAVLLGILTFCVADPRPGLALLAGVLIAGSWVLFRDTVISPLPRWGVNLLLLGASANLARLILTSPVALKEVAITLLAEYLIYLQLIKMFESRTPRDQAQLLVLNVMLVIGAVLTSVTIEIGAMLLLYTIAFIYAVMLYHLFAGQHRVFARRGHPAPVQVDLLTPGYRHMARALRRITAVAILAIIAGASVIFVVMPRDIGNEFIGRAPEPVSGASSGFSDSVQLGLSGLVSESRDIVLEFDLYIDGKLANTPVNQYLRGTVLDRYDPHAHTWDRSQRLRAGDKRNANMLRYARRGRQRLPQPRYSNTSTVQVFRVINKRTDHLFSLWRPDQVACEIRDPIYLNPADATLRMPNSYGLFTYAVRSYPYHRLSPTQGRGDDVDPEFRAPDSQPGSIRQRVFAGTPVEEYARELISQARLERTPDRQNDALILQLFERHLRDQFTYTLDLQPPPEGRDPLVDFLYETKSGHCEYFASAMAAMAQAVGIDARVITGFVTNEIDPASESYVVRKSHAHAWVQGRVLEPLDDLGDARIDVSYVPAWRSFDPTPPSQLSAEIRQRGGPIAWARRMIERAEQLWVRGIVAYSTDQQKAVLKSAGIAALDVEAPVGLLERLRNAPLGKVLQFITTAVVTLVFFLGVVFIGKVAIVWGGRRVRARAARWWLNRTNPDAAQRSRQLDLYNRMLRLLNRAGIPKPASLPPLAFARSIEPTRPDVAGAVERFATLYYETRFGPTAPSPEHLEKAERELRALHNALRAKARPAT